MCTVKLGGTARKAIRNAVLAAAGAALTLGAATGVETVSAQTASGSQAHTQAMSPARMYGNPRAAARYWSQQSLDDCGLMAAADVIGQLTNHKVSEREIIAVAQRLPSRSHPGPIYTPPVNMGDPNHSGHGTDPYDLPVLLARYGITAVFTSTEDAADTGLNTGMEALEHDLAGGHKVIVGVNAELIWGLPVQTRDDNGNPADDHAVVVTGVDTASGTVHLNDSGTPYGKDETVPIDVFVQSWAAGDDGMIVTQQTS